MKSGVLSMLELCAGLDEETYARFVRGEGPARPFLLSSSNPQVDRDLARRRYKYSKNALNGAMIQTKWLPVGTEIQIYEVSSSMILGEFKRHVNSLSFTEAA